MPDPQWLDQKVTDSFAALERVFSSDSDFLRLRGLLDGLILEKHFLNVVSRQKQADVFRLIDIGCGAGELVNRIARFFPRADCIGLDQNQTSIERAALDAPPNARFIQAGFDQAQEYGPGDFVICSEVFEHVPDTGALLDSLAKLVRGNGWLSLSTPSGWMYRLPGLYNLYKVLTGPRRFYRLYLCPEKHWPEALAIHPAIFPDKLRRMAESRGFVLQRRQSALWWFLEKGFVHRMFLFLEEKGWEDAGVCFHHLARLLDAAMNVIPLLRIFESRCIFLFGRTNPFG